jgi:predicted Zn-dependent peptidase
MERIKNTLKMDFVSRLTSLEGLSDELAWFEWLRTWKDLLDYPDKINAVVPATIPAIVRLYCAPELKTIGILIAENNKEQLDNSSGEKR